MALWKSFEQRGRKEQEHERQDTKDRVPCVSIAGLCSEDCLSQGHPKRPHSGALIDHPAFILGGARSGLIFGFVFSLRPPVSN